MVKKYYNVVQTETRITVSYSCRVCHSCPDLAANCVTTCHWLMNSIHKATVREFWCGLGPSQSKGSNQMHRPAVYTAQTPTVSCCSILTEPRLPSPEVPSHNNLCELLARTNLFNPLLHLTRVNITELVVMDAPPPHPSASRDSWVDSSGITRQIYAMSTEGVFQAVKSQTSCYLQNFLNKLSMRNNYFYRLCFQ